MPFFTVRLSEARYGMVSRGSEIVLTAKDESVLSQPSKHERQYLGGILGYGVDYSRHTTVRLKG
jgi:hypothetical protein